jgi:hypothetical protein
MWSIFCGINLFLSGKNINDEFVILDNYDDDIMYVITPNIWDFNDKIILLAENNKYRIYVLGEKNETESI